MTIVAMVVFCYDADHQKPANHGPQGGRLLIRSHLSPISPQRSKSPKLRKLESRQARLNCACQGEYKESIEREKN